MKANDYREDLLDTIIDLQQRGFDHDFVLIHEYIRCLQLNEVIAPDDFDIVESHHCCDSRYSGYYILYGIELQHLPVKGILMSNYQSYVSGISLRLWGKLYRELQKRYSQIQPQSSDSPLLYT